jgi:hypothetical protein
VSHDHITDREAGRAIRLQLDHVDFIERWADRVCEAAHGVIYTPPIPAHYVRNARAW